MKGTLDCINFTTIKNGSFYGSGVENLVNIDQITSISQYGFYNCTQLSGILNFSNIISIEEHAFQLDNHIKSIVLMKPNIDIGISAFDSNVNITISQPINLSREIVYNYNNREFIVFYTGLKYCDYESDSLIYDFAKRIYVLCEYPNKTFYGRCVFNPCVKQHVITHCDISLKRYFFGFLCFI